MARTYKQLWPRVVGWWPLLAAYRACRKRLKRELVEGEYQPRPYHHFYIFDPKKR